MEYQENCNLTVVGVDQPTVAAGGVQKIAAVGLALHQSSSCLVSHILRGAKGEEEEAEEDR